jgi:bile acid-coenzyme A ligase
MSFAARLAEIAREQPESAAVVGFDRSLAEERLTWAELVAVTERTAARLRETCKPNTVVAVAADNRIESVLGILSVLSAEMKVLPLNPRAPRQERNNLLEFVGRTGSPVVVLDPAGTVTAMPAGSDAVEQAASGASVLLSTGGSSGDVKVVAYRTGLHYDPARTPDPLYRHAGWHSGQRQLIVAPLHHAAPVTLLIAAVLDANTVILQTMFWPTWTMELIERYAVEWLQLAPSHMRACLQLGRPQREQVVSVRGLLHTAAHCDAATKRGWIDLLGAEKVFEMYASTEDVGATLIRGDEWLERPGSVGRGFMTKVRIIGPDGRRQLDNEVGKVYMRRASWRRDRRYLDGRAMDATPDGFVSVGDYGSLDADGYLYLAPRRTDMINVGGENVYPAEVEAVFLDHPDVADVVAVGVEDDMLGTTIQLQVVPRDGASLTAGALISFCADRLAPHKTPRDIVFVDQVARSAAGKIERRRIQPVAPGTTLDRHK